MLIKADAHDIRQEVWRVFPDSPLHYKVSSIGRVVSLPGVHWNTIDMRYTRRPFSVDPFRANPRFGKNLLVRMYWSNVVITRTLRWVVARTWVPNPDPERLTFANGPDDIFDCRSKYLSWSEPRNPRVERLVSRSTEIQILLRVAKPVNSATTPVRPTFSNNCSACVHFELEKSLPQNSMCKLLGEPCENVVSICKEWKLRSLHNRPPMLPSLNRRSLLAELERINSELEDLWINE